jgi:hypothetical protein
MMVNYPQEAWLVEKVRESVSEFGSFLLWNHDMSNIARILVKMRESNMLNIPISLVLSENTSDEGNGHSWTVVNYILHANLLGVNGGDDDPPHLMVAIHTPCQTSHLVVSRKMQILFKMFLLLDNKTMHQMFLWFTPHHRLLLLLTFSQWLKLWILLLLCTVWFRMFWTKHLRF